MSATGRPAGLTPSQTIGPFWHDALDRPDLSGMTAGSNSNLLTLHGTITDAQGTPVGDAMVEVWHADADGGHGGNGRDRFHRCATDARGRFELRTFRPGGWTDADGTVHAAHITIGLFARGLLNRLHTRAYFAGDPALDQDAVLALVPANRRATLLARPDGPQAWAFDIRLSGDGETVFLAC